MSVTYGFYNSIDHDRVYNAEQMSAIFDGIINDGVFMNIGDAFIVRATGGMNISVGSGRAWFNSTWTHNDSALALEVPAADLVLNRIDSIVLEVNHLDSVRANEIKIIKGEVASDAVAPELTNTTYIKQYRMADIYVKGNTKEITQSDITSYIGSEGFPYITGILQTVSNDSVVAQWQDEFTRWFDDKKYEYTDNYTQLWRQFRNEFDQLFADTDAQLDGNQEFFLSWMNRLQNELDSNQAGNLQNQIDKLTYQRLQDRFEVRECKVSFQKNGDIIETALDGSYEKITHFDDKGNATETYQDDLYVFTKNVRFDDDGSMIETFTMGVRPAH